MTRRSRREIERAVEDLGGDGDGDGGGLLPVYQDPVTGTYYDTDHDPLPTDTVENHDGMVVKLSRNVVLPREQAEREGRTIVAPADVPADGHVVVRPKWMD